MIVTCYFIYLLIVICVSTFLLLCLLYSPVHHNPDFHSTYVFKPRKEMGETTTTTTTKSDDTNTAPPKVKFALFDLDGCLYPIENGYAPSLVKFYSFSIHFFFFNKQVRTRVSRASV